MENLAHEFWRVLKRAELPNDPMGSSICYHLLGESGIRMARIKCLWFNPQSNRLVVRLDEVIDTDDGEPLDRLQFFAETSQWEAVLVKGVCGREVKVQTL